MSTTNTIDSHFKVNPASWGLVVFWAFVESFLGGVLHALQIPLRGIVIAGAAAACLITIAAVTGGNLAKPIRFFSTDLIRATLAVMAVKLILSPQAPPTAYVALLFQGFSAYLLFGLIPSFRVAAISFSVLALLETAFQKVVVLFIFFGSNFWSSFSTWLDELNLQFAFLSISMPVIIGTYLLLYLITGFGIGYWFGQWPKRAMAKSNELVALFAVSDFRQSEIHSTKKVIKRNTWMFLVLILLIIGWLIMPYSLMLTTFFRVLIIGLTIYLVSPLLQQFLKKLLSERVGDTVILKIIQSIDEQKSYFYFCWAYYQKKSILVRLLLSFESSLILSAAGKAQAVNNPT